MTGYCKFNQVVVLTSATVLDVGYLLKQISTGSVTWYAAINFLNVFFSTLFRKEDQKMLRFTWDRPQCTSVILLQGYVDSLALCRNKVRRDLDTPQNITLMHKEITLISLDEQKVACTLVALVIDSHNTGGKCYDDSGACHINTFLRCPLRLGAHWVIPSKVKDKLWHFVPFTTKKKSVLSAWPLQVLEAVYFSLGNTALPHMLDDVKTGNFEWRSKQEVLCSSLHQSASSPFTWPCDQSTLWY